MTHCTGTLVPFNNEEFALELLPAGDSFKVAAPGLARALGMREAYDLLRPIPESEKGSELVRTPGGEQHVGIVTEAGFYRAIGQRQAARISDPEIREKVERFQSWVYGTVLPEIRRTGSYGAPKVDVEAVTRGDLARMVLAAEEEKAVLEAALESAAPAIAYHDRHIAENSDLCLIEDWGRLVGLTKKQAFDMLVERNVIFRKTIGSRWSAKAQRVVEEYEYRARAGRATTDWFELRPQHNAPRLHNGQVRQTLMVKVFYVDQLATKCGLSRTVSLPIDSEVA